MIRSSGGSVGVRRVVVFSLGGLGIPHEGSCHALSRFHRITAATARGFRTGFEDGQGEGCPDRDELLVGRGKEFKLMAMGLVE